MNRIDIAIPDCEVYGALYESDDFFDLGEDMVDVVLPNGVLVSAGWVPEGDPNGQYRVAITNGLDHLSDPEFFPNATLAKDFIIAATRKYNAT